MPNIKTEIEIKGIKWLLARFASKSPEMYDKVTKIAAILAGICGLFIAAYTNGILIAFLPKYGTILGQIDNACITLGAAFTAVGLTSASTTTDPALLSKEVVANVVNLTNMNATLRSPIDEAKDVLGNVEKKN